MIPWVEWAQLGTLLSLPLSLSLFLLLVLGIEYTPSTGCTTELHPKTLGKSLYWGFSFGYSQRVTGTLGLSSGVTASA
jgi:hypothetical protein